MSRSRSHTIFETRRNYYTAGSQGFVEAYQRRGGTKRRGRVTRVISTMETGLSTGGGVGVRAVWVQRFAIITFRACRFVCINSVRQFPLCGVHSRARISSSPPSVLPLPPRPSPGVRGSGVFGQREAGRSFPGRICYPLESVNASFSLLSFHRPFVTLLYLTCARAAPPGQLPFLREPASCGQWRV